VKANYFLREKTTHRDLPRDICKLSASISEILTFGSPLKKLSQNNRHTSTGVRGHFPRILLSPGSIVLPLRLNFPLQPFSRTEFISNFSQYPPSYTQHENATMSYMHSCTNESCKYSQETKKKDTSMREILVDHIHSYLFKAEVDRYIFPFSSRGLQHDPLD